MDEIPNQCCKQWIKILSSIVSKAVEKFGRRRAVEWPASRATRISFCTYKSAVSEEWNLQYADWNVVNRLWEKRCVKRPFAILRSTNFERKERFEIGR